MSKPSDRLRNFRLGPYTSDRESVDVVLHVAADLMDACVYRIPGASLGTVECAICKRQWNEIDEPSNHGGWCVLLKLERAL